MSSIASSRRANSSRLFTGPRNVEQAGVDLRCSRPDPSPKDL